MDGDAFQTGMQRRIQLAPGGSLAPEEAQAFVKARRGNVMTPKQVAIWHELPCSNVGKAMKKEVRATMLAKGSTP